MAYKVRPLSITTPEWPTFINICQEELGYSPTRGIDSIGIKPDAPCAFLASLDMRNQPLLALRFENKAWNHFHASFIAVGSDTLLIEILVNTNLKVLYTQTENNTLLIILTGSILDWHDAIIKMSGPSINKEVSAVMNNCLVHLQEAGFRELWNEYDKIQLEDGTLTLRRR